MRPVIKTCSLALLVAGIGFSASTSFAAGGGAAAEELLPTHADAAVVLAKYSGLFDGYVSDEATLNDCVAFLNRSGIYFGLLEVINGTEFTVVDCARVMGQMNLLFSGEAECLAGKVKLPLGIDSWEEFCILNDVKYVQGYESLKSTLDLLQHLSR